MKLARWLNVKYYKRNNWDIRSERKSINYDILSSSSTIGDKAYLYPKLKQSFKTATTIDIIVLLEDLKEALNRGV